jgi:hypothetical protein
MNLIESKEELERVFYLRLLGNCGAAQPQLSNPSATSTEGHRPRNTHQGFSPLQSRDKFALWTFSATLFAGLEGCY